MIEVQQRKFILIMLMNCDKYGFESASIAQLATKDKVIEVQTEKNKKNSKAKQMKPTNQNTKAKTS